MAVSANIADIQFFKKVRKVRASMTRLDPTKFAMARDLAANGATATMIWKFTGLQQTPDGKFELAAKNPVMEVEDWISFKPIDPDGMPSKLITVRRPVAEMRIDESIELDPTDYKSVCAREAWRRIEPEYKIWLRGNEEPNGGTSFSIWPGITPLEAEYLRQHGMRTVEELRDAPASRLNQMNGLPQLERLQRDAGLFLDAMQHEVTAQRMSTSDKELEAMRKQIQELSELAVAQHRELEEVKAAGGEPLPEKRKPGRPRTVVHDEQALEDVA